MSNLGARQGIDFMLITIMFVNALWVGPAIERLGERRAPFLMAVFLVLVSPRLFARAAAYRRALVEHTASRSSLSDPRQRLRSNHLPGTRS